MTGQQCLVAALYHVDAGFAGLGGFLENVPSFADLPYERTAVIGRLDSTIGRLRAFEPPIDRERALRLLLAEDLALARRALESAPVAAAIDARSDMVARLRACHQDARSILRRHGVDDDAAELFVVEGLPEPYHDRGLSALTADAGDHAAYGITPGVYLLADHLTPFYSEQLLCHELVHAVLGARSPDLIGRGLEEGIAELLGVFHVGQQLLGPAAIRGIFVYGRLSAEYHPRWEQYLDWARAALLLHRAVGTAGLYALLRVGRAGVKRAERSILAGRPPAPGRAACDEDAWAGLAEHLCLAYPRTAVVSPLARYIVRFVRRGATVSEIAEAARVEREAALAALQELQDTGMLLLFDAGRRRVEWSDCEMYAGSSLPRYRV